MNNETLNRLNAFVADYKKESEDKDAIIKQQNQTLLHISAELEAIKQYDPLDRVLVSCSIENISAIIKGETKLLIDDDCVGCAGPCKVVDVAAELQEELDDYKKTIQLERIDRAAEKDVINHKYSEDLRKKNATIEELKDRNIEDLHELYDLYERELKQVKSDSVIMLTNCHNVNNRLETTIEDREHEIKVLKDTIKLDIREIDGLEVELSALKDDSAVLMKVVEIVRDDKIYPHGAIHELADLLVDYLDAPEGPPETPIDEPQEITITVAFLELP